MHVIRGQRRSLGAGTDWTLNVLSGYLCMVQDFFRSRDGSRVFVITLSS
jgi:hypothetical protein